MYYIIQKNVFRDPRYDKIFDTLEALNLSYEVVDLAGKNYVEYETMRKDVFVYGSVKLAILAQKYGWKPGSFYGGNHNFEIYNQKYGVHLLNHESAICKFSDALIWEDGEEKFIRPSKDAKVFTGSKFTQMKWDNFVNESLNNNSNKFLSKNTLIQVAKPRHILKEARIWIVGGKVITSSYYRFHGDIDYEESVAQAGLDFAKKMADIYQVADAFVMDICLTADGWKIVEINCVNSAGFYKGDIRKLILALEEFKKKGDEVN